FSNFTPIVTGINGGPDAIALDSVNDKLYWVEKNTLQIKRANLDGTNVETITTTSSAAQHLAIDNASNRIWWIEGTKIRYTTLAANQTAVDSGITDSSITGDGGLALVYAPAPTATPTN